MAFATSSPIGKLKLGPVEAEEGSSGRTRWRPPWDRWYGTRRWKARRERQLRREPLCRICYQRDIVTPASICDHEEPHHGDRTKFDFGALISLCVACHNGDKRSIERRGYNNRIGEDGLPIDKVNHPAYVKRF
jgi:hypothetical protein